MNNHADMVAVFFYGLFMDAGLLSGRGVNVSWMSRAYIVNYRLVLGKRATLVPALGFTAHGMLARLERRDLDKLYSDPSVSAYRPEKVRVVLEDGTTSDALCYNLPARKAGAAPDREYARKLYELGKRLGLPALYLAQIRRVAEHEVSSRET